MVPLNDRQKAKVKRVTPSRKKYPDGDISKLNVNHSEVTKVPKPTGTGFIVGGKKVIAGDVLTLFQKKGNRPALSEDQVKQILNRHVYIRNRIFTVRKLSDTGKQNFLNQVALTWVRLVLGKITLVEARRLYLKVENVLDGK